MHSTFRRITAAAIVAVFLTFACADEGPTGPTLTTIDVTSLVDSILAVGKTTQLGAAAKDAAGSALSGITLTWASSNPAAFTVTSAGAITAVAAGTSTITASANGITGLVRMRAVQADLTTITTLSGDGFATALINAITPAKRTAVQTAWGRCATGASSGGVVGIQQCGTQVAAEATSAGDATDKALITTLQLYSDDIQRRLGL